MGGRREARRRAGRATTTAARTRVEYRAAALGRIDALRPRLRLRRRARRRSRGRSSKATCCVRSTAGTRSRAEDGGTRVTYDLRVDLAIPLPGLVKRRAAGHDHRHGVAGPEAGRRERMTDDARDEPHPEAVDYEDGRDARSAPLPPPSALEIVIAELLAAVPEVRDSLLAAADSLLDAATRGDRRRRPRRRSTGDRADPPPRPTRSRPTRDVRRRPRWHQPARRRRRCRRHDRGAARRCRRRRRSTGSSTRSPTRSRELGARSPTRVGARRRRGRAWSTATA